MCEICKDVYGYGPADIDELRIKFEWWLVAHPRIKLDILARCAIAPGILRDYRDQETELQWRAYVAGYMSS